MSPWWSKSSSKEVKKKSSKESFIDSIQRKLKNASESKFNSRSKVSRRRNDFVSEKGSQSPVGSQSLSTSTLVSRCHSFAERPHAQPLPLPEVHLNRIRGLDSGNGPSAKPATDTGSKPLMMLPPPNQRHVPNVPAHADAEGDLGTDSVSSGSSTDSDDPSDSRLLSPQASDYENGNKASLNSPSANHRDQSPITTQKKSREKFKPAGILLNNPILPTSPKHSPSSRHVPSLQIHQYGAFFSAPDSSMSSPSRSPMRAFGPEPVLNSGFWAGRPCADVVLSGSGQCSSPGSGQNSGHNSIGGDMSAQLFWQHSRCSPECSPIPSPRMTSPGPSSRIQSGSVTPLHPRAGGSASESSANWPDDAVNGKQQSHRLPLPPLTISNTGPFSPSYSTGTTPTVPRSPGRTDNSTSPGSRWKKGRLLGRGTFGHVYLGFNSESGEMCAMKEVTLFADDAKSRESAQQLGQEIALLSRLRHPNIVQYYGSETVDDKLYIYLEYVSGGSIYKLLQDYGQLGEIAIRSYTHQILSGLSYLHGKNTVHRDIKGANILVDPNGRVKLADFGMAKHISGQACPLSFKGSPYWMAPEVINNSNGCNLAVDIWSLGCTVLEMATTKPPWSQYEGVAALFKVGNSKELPTIPEHLSDDGKDFILKCLQRNPLHRPTAVQLLEHPFVKNISPSERLIPRPEPTEAVPVITNAVRSMGIGQARNISCLDSEGLSGHHTRGPKSGSGFSDSLMQRNYISCPVSPMGSPLLHARSPQHANGRMSPSMISSPHAISGSSTPLTGAVGAVPSYQQIQKQQPTTYMQDGTIGKPRSPNGFYPNSGSPYQDMKPHIFPKVPQGSPFFQEMVPPENGFLGNQLGRPLHQVDHLKETHNGQLVLADRVSQQLLKDHMKQNLSIDLNPSGARPKD